FENRWIAVTCADPESPTSSVFVGVSTTSDPTRGWNLFRVDADPQDQVWADYPSVGFNGKWIAVSLNMFPNDPTSANFFGVNIWTFDKEDLYNAGTGRFTLLKEASGFTMAPAVTLDQAEQTLYLVESFGDRRLRISTITGAVGQERLNTGSSFVVSTDPWSTFGGEIGPQQGSNAFIDSGDHRMLNVVFRNGALWCAHTIFLPAGGNPTRSSAQWWQINPNGTIIQRGRIDDSSGNTFYAYPTIAVNSSEDAMLGFSVFNRTNYASAAYAFRSRFDPTNTFEASYIYKN